MIDASKEIGLSKVLLTIRNHNIPSIYVALANGGVIEKITEINTIFGFICRFRFSEVLDMANLIIICGLQAVGKMTVAESLRDKLK